MNFDLIYEAYGVPKKVRSLIRTNMVIFYNKRRLYHTLPDVQENSYYCTDNDGTQKIVRLVSIISHPWIIKHMKNLTLEEKCVAQYEDSKHERRTYKKDIEFKEEEVSNGVKKLKLFGMAWYGN